jgi:hypothetical protein
MLPCVVFMFVWATLIYDPIACWTWNDSGWSHKIGGLDFAGGTPVHISSGSAALAYSLMLGKRRGHGTHELNYRPHNVTHIVLGTVFLWVGWFGFNGGSALAANLRAVNAIINTNLSASVGGITWCLLDYRLEHKWSTVGFCSGVIAGLVAITPGSGFVSFFTGQGYLQMYTNSSRSLLGQLLSTVWLVELLAIIRQNSNFSLVSTMPLIYLQNTVWVVSLETFSLPSSLRMQKFFFVF